MLMGERDGMAPKSTADGEPFAEVFEDYATDARTFTVFGELGVPLEAIEWLLSESKTQLY
jgi:hypothetical protein